MKDNLCPHCGMDITEYAQIEKRDAEFFRKFRRVIKVALIISVFYVIAVLALAYWGYL